ncbi:MAG: hypothetical protein OEW62_08275 [Candidatus Bathyarchaeota archaeon]|nr:hypothetical protein [Candidatus Bathyarchaeota archaeon]
MVRILRQKMILFRVGNLKKKLWLTLSRCVEKVGGEGGRSKVVVIGYYYEVPQAGTQSQ